MKMLTVNQEAFWVVFYNRYDMDVYKVQNGHRDTNHSDSFFCLRLNFFFPKNYHVVKITVNQKIVHVVYWKHYQVEIDQRQKSPDDYSDQKFGPILFVSDRLPSDSASSRRHEALLVSL